MNNTLNKIIKEWEPIVSEGLLSKNTVFYRGFSAEKEIDPCKYSMPSSYGYWFSENESVAYDYAYRDVGRVPYLAKCLIRQDLKSIKFPCDYHPADVFFEKASGKSGWNINYAKPRQDLKSLGMQPDHFIAKHWNQLMSIIDAKFTATSYFRNDCENKGLFSEIWISNSNDFIITSLEKLVRK